MKNTILTLFATLYSSFFTLNSPAAVPLSWTVETSHAQPATFEAYQGETIDFEAALQAKGKPLEAPLNYSFFWQTNGMGNLYWEAPAGPVPASSLAGASTNVLFATFDPSMDVGAKVYNCFIGSPSNIYHAAFQLRLRPSPGALPNALPLPQPVIDFARVRVLNPPWSGGGGGGSVDTNAVVDIANATIATNNLVVATTNRVAALDTATNNLTSSVSTLSSSVSSLQSSKADKSELSNFLSIYGGAVDTGFYLDAMYGTLGIYGGPNGQPMWACTGNFYCSSGLFVGGYDWSWLKNFTGSLQDVLDDLAPLSMISATDRTFSNEVATVAKTVQPTTVRAYDSVRRCWWVLEIVNGVPTWTVED